jgi:hypothetical protein
LTTLPRAVTLPAIKDHIVDTDWSALSFGERVRHLEVEGYIVIPDLLDAGLVEELRRQLKEVSVQATDYTDKKLYHNDIQLTGGAITDLVAHEPTIAFLRRLFGGEPIMMTYDYSRSEPGCPAINLHCDGWPRLVRVLYYLEDLTPEVAPSGLCRART